MGRKALAAPKERHHVHLTQGSWERLTELYAPHGITPSAVIAKLVDHHIRRVEETANVSPSSMKVEGLLDE